MHRIGTTPEFGVPEAEEGLFVNNVSYTPQFEAYEQPDKNGEIMGMALYKQKVEVELTGEVPHVPDGQQRTASKILGAAIELNNSCPDDCWLGGTPPAATTSVLTAAPVTYSRESARERTYTGVILPFGSESATA